MDFNLPACEEKFALTVVAMGENNVKYSRMEPALRELWQANQLYINQGFPNKLDKKEVGSLMSETVMKKISVGFMKGRLKDGSYHRKNIIKNTRVRVLFYVKRL